MKHLKEMPELELNDPASAIISINDWLNTVPLLCDRIVASRKKEKITKARNEQIDQEMKKQKNQFDAELESFRVNLMDCYKKRSNCIKMLSDLQVQYNDCNTTQIQSAANLTKCQYEKSRCWYC